MGDENKKKESLDEVIVAIGSKPEVAQSNKEITSLSEEIESRYSDGEQS